jgi:deazaflavin-dependent oxidoreductase (nitroreductase family)
MNSHLLAGLIVLGVVAAFFTLPWTLSGTWYRSLFYRGGRPNAFTKRLNSAQAWLTARGIFPALLVALETKGRRTGKPLLTQLVVARVGTERYLVSMLGENVDWVRNVRAAAGKAVLRYGRDENVTLDEVPASQRAPILKAYLQVAPGGRPHFDVDRAAPLSEFRKIAAHYPVFRIVSR